MPLIVALSRQRVADALREGGDELPEKQRIVSLAANHRLPAVYEHRNFTVAGGLMPYGPDISDTFRRPAGHVDKILKDAKPADLPVEQPTKVERVINL